MQFPWPAPKYTTIADCYPGAIFSNEFQYQIENDYKSPEAQEYIASMKVYNEGKREFEKVHPEEYAAFMEKYVIELDNIDTLISNELNQVCPVRYNGVMDYFYKVYPKEFEELEKQYPSMYEMAEFLNSPEFYESEFSQKLLSKYTEYHTRDRLKELGLWFRDHMYDVRQCEKRLFGNFPREPEVYWE